jgi:hypothetical protein
MPSASLCRVLILRSVRSSSLLLGLGATGFAPPLSGGCSNERSPSPQLTGKKSGNLAHFGFIGTIFRTYPSCSISQTIGRLAAGLIRELTGTKSVDFSELSTPNKNSPFRRFEKSPSGSLMGPPVTLSEAWPEGRRRSKIAGHPGVLRARRRHQRGSCSLRREAFAGNPEDRGTASEEPCS